MSCGAQHGVMLNNILQHKSPQSNKATTQLDWLLLSLVLAGCCTYDAVVLNIVPCITLQLRQARHLKACCY